MQWNYSEPPKDRVILRWHKIYRCVVSVSWSGMAQEERGCPWITATVDNTWPEESFVDGWAEQLQPPSSNTDFNLTQPAASQVKS